MPVHLIETGEKPDEVREILIDKEEFLLGRGPDCNLQINEAEISRHHCLFRGRGDDYTLSDLGSSNGTYLNGQRLRSQATIKSGDLVQVGKHSFVVDIGDREGIVWGTQKGVSPTDVTHRFSKTKKLTKPDKEL